MEGFATMDHKAGREVVIVEAVRTPIGRGHKEKGYYKDVHPSNLLAKTYSEVIERAEVRGHAHVRRHVVAAGTAQLLARPRGRRLGARPQDDLAVRGGQSRQAARDGAAARDAEPFLHSRSALLLRPS